MKQIKVFCLLLIALVISFVCRAKVADSSNCYTRAQVDSIVAIEVQRQVESVVKAEMIRQVDKELIELKVDRAANEKLGTYITEQNNHLTMHDFFMGGIITFLVAIVGVVIPLIMNHNSKERLQKLENRINDIAEKVQDAKQDAEKSARKSKFSQFLSQAWNEKDFNKQIDLVSKLIKEYPEKDFVSESYFARGTFYGNNGDYDKSIIDLTEAINRNPDDAEAHYNRGLSYGYKGDDDKAIEDYTEAIRINSNYADAYNNRGISYANKKEYNNSIKDFTEAIRIKPNAKAYYNRGLSYSKIGDYDMAIVDFTKAIRIKPDYADAYNDWAWALCSQKKYEEALPLINKAIELDADDSNFYDTRCVVNKGLGKKEDALNDAKKGLKIAKRKSETKMLSELEKKIKDLENNGD
jgi:tetratricopeptide (TPR) repeat protein